MEDFIGNDIINQSLNPGIKYNELQGSVTSLRAVNVTLFVRVLIGGQSQPRTKIPLTHCFQEMGNAPF